jgi:hypothetical protein
VIEALGIPTLVIGTTYDIMSKVVPPRAAFVDHPVGRTFGPPDDRERNVAILAKALSELAQFTQAGMVRDLGCNWARDGSRSWEEELRAEMRREH